MLFDQTDQLFTAGGSATASLLQNEIYTLLDPVTHPVDGENRCLVGFIDLMIFVQFMSHQFFFLHVSEEHLQHVLLKDPEIHLIEVITACQTGEEMTNLRNQHIDVPGIQQLTPLSRQEYLFLGSLVFLMFYPDDRVLTENIILAVFQQRPVSSGDFLTEDRLANIAEDLRLKHLLAL